MGKKSTVKSSNNKKNIFVLIELTKQKMMNFQLSTKTIASYNSNGFNEVVKCSVEHNILLYNPSFLNELVAEKSEAYKRQEIGRMKYQTFRKTVSLLQEVYTTGKLEWRVLPSWNQKCLTKQFANAVELYCDYEQSFLASGTISVYKSAIRQFLFSIEDMKVYKFKSISRLMTNNAMTILAPQYPCGMKSVFPAVKSFLKFLYESKLIDIELHNSLPEHCSPRRVIRYGFSNEELQSILESVDRTSSTGKRDYAIMLLGIHAGLRVVDIANLTFKNIDWLKREIKITQHKTGKPLITPIQDTVLEAIAEYILEGRPESDSSFIFLSNSKPFRALANRSASLIATRYIKKSKIDTKSIPRRGFHSFRRTFGANLLQSQIPLEMLSELLGHSSIDNSKPYLAINRNDLCSCCLDLSGLEVKEGVLKW